MIEAQRRGSASNSQLVPAARLELARLAAADFESATSTDFVTRAGRADPVQQHPEPAAKAARIITWGVLRPGRAQGLGTALRQCLEPGELRMPEPRCKTLEDAIGGTPLVRLQRVPGADAAARGNVILGKLEGNNPAGSVKDRPAISMIRRAEERGDIRPGDVLIEATSGNTGIALAMAAAIRGYRMVLIMPEDLSVERAQTMKAFGAELVLTPKSGGMEYARDLAEQMQRDGKGRVLDQFANADNPRVHYETTGPEIWADTGGRVTHFVSAMGTTGTITGVSRYLKEKNPAVRIVGAQPAEGSRIPGIRKWPEAYLPKIYEPSRVDELVLVSQADAEEMSRRLAREEGLFGGISAAGACWVAMQISAQVRDAVIVFIVCDRGDRYLSTGVFPA
jgi:S-sulfo-L-cysteine synthase (O-acetyl-L-serine-dependent)